MKTGRQYMALLKVFNYSCRNTRFKTLSGFFEYEIEVFTHNILLAGLELLTDITLTLFLVLLLFYIELNITIFTIAIFFIDASCRIKRALKVLSNALNMTGMMLNLGVFILMACSNIVVIIF